VSRISVNLEPWMTDVLDMLAKHRQTQGQPASRSAVLRTLLEQALEPYRPEPAQVKTPNAA